MKHRETHPEPVEGCFGCKLGSVQIATSSAGAAVVNERERRWDRDMPAYKRLRGEGLQPRSIDGSAELERKAHDKLEIEMGHLWESKADRERAVETMSAARELSEP